MASGGLGASGCERRRTVGMIGRRPAATPGERALRPGGPVAGWRQGLHTSAIGPICALALAAVASGQTAVPAATPGLSRAVTGGTRIVPVLRLCDAREGTATSR